MSEDTGPMSPPARTRTRGRHAAPSLVDTGEYGAVEPASAREPEPEFDDTESDYDDEPEDDVDDEDDTEDAPAKPPAVVEPKVIAGTAGSFVISTALAQFNNMSDAQILDGFGLNPTIQYVIILLVPPLITFVSGYFTRSQRG